MRSSCQLRRQLRPRSLRPTFQCLYALDASTPRFVHTSPAASNSDKKTSMTRNSPGRPRPSTLNLSRPPSRPTTYPSSQITRPYAIQAPGTPTLQVFNRHTKYLQKERAAGNVSRSREVDYLRDEVAIRLSERLLDINRRFENVLDLGAGACNIAKALTRENPDPAKADMGLSSEKISGKIGRLVCAESSPTLLHRDQDESWNSDINLERKVIANEEDLSGFEAESFDAVLSSLSMHWINDLPSTLSQINHILKPDAPLIACMWGGDTLFELRTSLQLASMERLGGISPHMSPLADVRDIGGLLTKAGFKLLTVDIDDIVVEYPDIFALMMDLQAMGESNAVLGREMGGIGRDVLLAAEGIYRELHGTEARMGGLPATFRLIYFIGWREGEGQSTPLERGSGEINISDVLGGGTIR